MDRHHLNTFCLYNFIDFLFFFYSDIQKFFFWTQKKIRTSGKSKQKYVQYGISLNYLVYAGDNESEDNESEDIKKGDSSGPIMNESKSKI